MSIKKHIPNFITFLNLSAGLLALVHAFNGNYNEAFSLVCLGIFFDFWDGFFARKFNVSGDLGLQLDSLADLITAGLVPGVVMYKMFADIQENQPMYNLTQETWFMGAVPYIGFIITLASAYRLAKFNIDTRQTDSFIGLPTPANALLILSIPMIIYNTPYEAIADALSNPYFLLVITLISSYLLNAELPLFSLKIKNFTFAKYKLQISFLAVSVLLLLVLQYLAIPLIILLYVLLSILVRPKAVKE